MFAYPSIKDKSDSLFRSEGELLLSLFFTPIVLSGAE